MTSAAERIKEQHRGARKAEPASASRLAALNTFGLRYVHVDDFNVIVEGEYQLNLAMSFWRATDGSTQGYLVSALNDEIMKNRNSEKPVADSISISPPELTKQEPNVEPVTGTPLLLPVVNQWP